MVKSKEVHEDKRDTKGNMQEHSGASCLSVLLHWTVNMKRFLSQPWSLCSQLIFLHMALYIMSEK